MIIGILTFWLSKHNRNTIEYINFLNQQDINQAFSQWSRSKPWSRLTPFYATTSWSETQPWTQTIQMEDSKLSWDLYDISTIDSQLQDQILETTNDELDQVLENFIQETTSTNEIQSWNNQWSWQQVTGQISPNTKTTLTTTWIIN
jgi:hypothetical protein